MSEASATVMKAAERRNASVEVRTTLIVTIGTSSCELLVGHSEGVEHDYTIICILLADLINDWGSSCAAK